MTLTAQQLVDTRRWMGYATIGDASYASMEELAYTDTSPFGAINLTTRLANLSPEEETTLINIYLTPLAARETEIQGAAANLDTASAAVWVHNPREVQERKSLFKYLRLEMCAFLGFPPGPKLGGGNRVVRA
jgi:hypothetical protein